MSFGKRLLEARKKRSISQEYLAEKLGTKGPVIGRYERDEMKPSIEVATKIANILEVSLDWLVGHTDMELDKNMIQRIQEVSRMQPKKKNMYLPCLMLLLQQQSFKGICL
jgi:transcriptional regulator with XRE-family HTH domain